MTAWRVTRRRYRSTAFSGERAARSGARWNSPGRRAVYLASHLSLAALEMLVHADLAALPTDYVAIPVEIPESMDRQVVDVAGLPADWQGPGDGFCRILGDAWLDAGRCPMLDAPSAVIPLERNVILNPSHAAVALIDANHIGYPFRFDSRLLAMLKLP